MSIRSKPQSVETTEREGRIAMSSGFHERSDGPSTPSAKRWPYLVILVLSLVGEGVAIKLARIHYDVHHDSTTKSFCALSEAVNCDTVALSPYSVFLGVPVAVWGMYGYALLALTAAWARATRQRRAPTVILAGLTGAAVLTSVALATISVLLIESLCILCLTTYLINTVLVVLLVIGWPTGDPGVVRHAVREMGTAWQRLVAPGILVASVALALGLFFPHYWQGAPAEGVQRSVQSAQASAGSQPSRSMATGVTEDGHHWIGARNPRVVVEEFSDYQCPFCQRAHFQLRELVREHPDAIRLVHRHLPLDHHCNPLISGTFHPRACYYAALSVCAGEQDRFWDANDFLYAHGRDAAPVTPQALEAELGVNRPKLEECLTQRAWGGVRLDLEEAVRMQLSATPTFRVNGQVYVGQVPPEVLDASVKARGAVGSG